MLTIWNSKFDRSSNLSNVSSSVFTREDPRTVNSKTFEILGICREYIGT